MTGLTASCKTKVNCSGEDTLLKLTTACATCAMCYVHLAGGQII